MTARPFLLSAALRQNATKMKWNANKRRAVVLLAEDEKSDEEIAQECGIHRATLDRWKHDPEFASAVSEHVRALEAEMFRYSIAKRRQRVKALDDRWKRMRAVIDARALEMGSHNASILRPLAEQGVDPSEGWMLDDRRKLLIAGGETGLLAHQERAIGSGKNQQIIHEYAVDTGLLRELRAHEEQAAKELGQWVDKGELAVDDRDLSDEDRVARITAILDRARARRDGQSVGAEGDQLDAASGTADDGI